MGNTWSVRRARAAHLLDRIPHAEEILTFYVGLTEVQEAVAAQVPVAEWLGLIRSHDGDFPWLRVEKLPLDGLALPFRDFLSRVTDLGTETIRDGARTLLSQDDDRRLESLRTELGAWAKPELFSFYARAFLEPVVIACRQAGVPPYSGEWNLRPKS